MKLATIPSFPTLNGPLSLVPRRPSTRANNLIVVGSSRGGQGGGEYAGRAVDEEMIVLRMRIREMEAKERDKLPRDWMEWERHYYAYYIRDVCEAVGLLQSWLMNVRPSLALGIVALILSALPAFAGIVLFHAFICITK